MEAASFSAASLSFFSPVAGVVVMVLSFSFSTAVELVALSSVLTVGAGLAAFAMTDDGLLTSEADLRPANVGGISVFLTVADSSLFFSVDVEVKDPNEMVGGLSAVSLAGAAVVVRENFGAGTISVGLLDALSSFSLSLPSGE